jgi:hypothetical protein
VALTCSLLMAACASHAPTAAAPPAPERTDAPLPLIKARPSAVRMCKIEGCCPGRGDVAYLQSDWFVICAADGLPSDICDCH